MNIHLKKIIALSMSAQALLLGACANKGTDAYYNQLTDKEYQEIMEEAKTTPYGRYPELIEYTLGKLTGTDNSNMPDGDTYEDNAYTRLLKDKLNIQNVDIFEGYGDKYDASVSMAIKSGNIPDLMVVSSYDDVVLLNEYNLIEDLSDAYENCMSDTIKDIYASYGDSIIENVTIDGKLVAIPETNITDGPNLVWLRKDWMDDLGLEAPKTIYDVEEIVRQFIEKDPGNNGTGKTVGLVCDPGLCGGCGYSSEYMLDLIFSTYGAYPKQWIYDSDGNVTYGSIEPEAKEALGYINSLYMEGVLDKDFLLRTNSNIIELINNGICGSFFGPWWAPNNPLMGAVSNNPEAEWMPYLIQTDDDGKTSYYSQNPSYKYVVVRKGFEYPEIACKIVSTLFDYARYDEPDNEEFKNYYKNNVDPTARPLAINVDYNNALQICYENINQALIGAKSPDTLEFLEKSYYESCEKYLQDKEQATPEEWAAYTSRVTACALLDNNKLNVVESLFFGKTYTMSQAWWKLEDMEKSTYLKIVTGDLPLDEFDDFVAKWRAGGGNAIISEVSRQLEG